MCTTGVCWCIWCCWMQFVLESGCCLLDEVDGWGAVTIVWFVMRIVVSGCEGIVLVFRHASGVCLCLVCSMLRCVELCFVMSDFFCILVLDTMGDNMVEAYWSMGLVMALYVESIVDTKYRRRITDRDIFRFLQWQWTLRLIRSVSNLSAILTDRVSYICVMGILIMQICATVHLTVTTRK